MMNRKPLAVAAAAALATLSACSVGASDGSSSDATLTFFGTEPTSLLGQKDPGSQVAMAMCANLTEVNSDTQELEPNVAESIETTDNRHYTIKLRDWTFHDGSPVTASSYVDAWNATAYAPNALLGNAFFSAFEGYAELNPDDGSEPATKELSGVKAVDDKTIEITTVQPNVDLPQILSTSAMCPLPAAYFEDPEAYEKEPFSNGPYEFVSWEHNQQVKLKKWKDFPGEDGFSGGADVLINKIYTDAEAAYTDLVGGNLDMIRNVPANLVERAESDLGQGSIHEIPEQRQQYTLQFPAYVTNLADPNLRKAISRSIDRDAIAATVLKGQAVPSDSLVTSLFDSYRPGACEACAFDLAAARTLLDKATGFDGTLKITFSSPADDLLAQAIANQVRSNLGIEVKLDPKQPAEISELAGKKQLDAAVITLWGLSYVSEDQFLSQYVTNGDGNVPSRYSNSDVDATVAEALSTSDKTLRAGTYQDAEDLILADQPVVPLFVPNQYGLHSECADIKTAQGGLQFYRAGYAC